MSELSKAKIPERRKFIKEELNVSELSKAKIPERRKFIKEELNVKDMIIGEEMQTQAIKPIYEMLRCCVN